MFADCLLADEEAASYFLVQHAFSEQFQDLILPVGEDADGFALGKGVDASGPALEGVDHFSGDLAAHGGAAFI